jgi:hypothetical protein
VSDTLDQLVRAARGGASERRSVVGTVEVSGEDLALEGADAALQEAFAFPRHRARRVSKERSAAKLARRATR